MGVRRKKIKTLKMKILLIGSEQFGVAVLEKLSAMNGIKIMAVSAPAGDKLSSAASKLQLKTFETQKLKEESIKNEWLKYGADLTVLAFVNDIVSDDILQNAIQFHPSLLPLQYENS